MTTVVVKRENDWCYLCSRRKNKLVGISYELKNESEKNENNFLRICSDCLKRIQKTMDDKTLNNQMVLECFEKKI